MRTSLPAVAIAVACLSVTPAISKDIGLQKPKYNASQANAMAVYRCLLSKNPELSKHPSIQQWLGSLPVTSAQPPAARQFARFAGTLPAVQQAQTQHADGDYYHEMVTGGAQRWSASKFPLRVYIDQSGGAGYRPSLPSFFHQAMNNWTDSSRSRLQFALVNQPECADITVQWLPYSTATECGDTVTKWVPDGAGNQWITHAYIKISTSGATGPISDQEIAKVCLHELGHALGLKHSSSPGDIMYFQSNQAQITALGSRDSATINRLYGIN